MTNLNLKLRKHKDCFYEVRPFRQDDKGTRVLSGWEPIVYVQGHKLPLAPARTKLNAQKAAIRYIDELPKMGIQP